MAKIYIYQNTGALNQKPEGSIPDALEEMKQMYMDELGIEPIAIVPPKGSEGEKLNLLLGSKDEVDVFQGIGINMPRKGDHSAKRFAGAAWPGHSEGMASGSLGLYDR